MATSCFVFSDLTLSLHAQVAIIASWWHSEAIPVQWVFKERKRREHFWYLAFQSISCRISGGAFVGFYSDEVLYLRISVISLPISGYLVLATLTSSTFLSYFPLAKTIFSASVSLTLVSTLPCSAMTTLQTIVE